MSVTVVRGLGDKPGPAVNSEVLTTPALQRERGRQECNETDSDRIRLSGSLVNAGYMPPGSIIEVTDADKSKRGYLESYSKTAEMNQQYASYSAVDIEQVKE